MTKKKKTPEQLLQDLRTEKYAEMAADCRKFLAKFGHELAKLRQAKERRLSMGAQEVLGEDAYKRLSGEKQVKVKLEKYKPPKKEILQKRISRMLESYLED